MQMARALPSETLIPDVWEKAWAPAGFKCTSGSSNMQSQLRTTVTDDVKLKRVPRGPL